VLVQIFAFCSRCTSFVLSFALSNLICLSSVLLSDSGKERGKERWRD
jgi:hypothetical protein